MSEAKDPKIKLFGRTIELPENSAAAADESGEPGSARSREAPAEDGSSHDPPCSSDSMVEDSSFMGGDAEEQESVETPSSLDKHRAKEEEDNSTGPSKPDGPEDSTNTDSNRPAAGNMTQNPEEEQPEMAGGTNEKTLKKPDKILPCPRCNSMDTKFCYFNNYNVNQPRHFCKNCQRYWTAGGTIRNIPVGAGRRKNKSSSTAAAASHLRPLAVPLEAFHQGPGRATDGTVLAFGGPDSPLCDSISSALNIADHAGRPGPEPEPRAPLAQWAYHHPWGPAQWAVPFYQATPPPSFWGWSMPCIVPTMGIGPGLAPGSSGPNSPTLGKHSREGEAAKEKRSDPEKCLWVPKTLRIDDPSEAAKSSIWATLGIKNEGRAESGKGGGSLFKAFGKEPKGKEKPQVPEASLVLQANPAALSRAMSFHENS